MNLLPREAVSAFFVRTVLALAAALTVWYLLREPLVRPLAAWAEAFMSWSFPTWTAHTELQGTTLALRTHLTARSAAGAGELAPEVDLLTYSYGTPLLVALLLGSRAAGWAWKLPLAWMLLLPFQAFGVCTAWLVQVAVHAGAQTQAQTGFGSTAVNLIGAGYQLGFLILPMLMPVLLWLALDRRLVRLMQAQGVLAGSLAGASPRD